MSAVAWTPQRREGLQVAPSAKGSKLFGYVRGLLQSFPQDAPERELLERIHMHIFSQQTQPAAQIVADLAAGSWKFKGDKPQVEALAEHFSKLLNQIGTQGDLKPTELTTYVSSRGYRATDPDEKFVLQRVGSVMRGRRDVANMLGDDLVAVLNELCQPAPHERMSQDQQQKMTDVIKNLGEATANPAIVRGYIHGPSVRELLKKGDGQRGESKADKEPLKQVLECAKGSVVIHTDTAAETEVTLAAGRVEAGYGGFKTFGDGVDSPFSQNPSRYLTHSPDDGFPDSRGGTVHPIERVSFVPVTETVYESVNVRQRGWRGVLGQSTSHQVPHHERPVMVEGPGAKAEPAVRFGYAYWPSSSYPGPAEYREVNGSRSGNVLTVEAVLPKSVADKLAREISENPETAREVVERLVLERGGVDPAEWRDGRGFLDGRRSNPMRPPWNASSADTSLYRIRVDQDGYVADPAKGWELRQAAAATQGPAKQPGTSPNGYGWGPGTPGPGGAYGGYGGGRRPNR